MKQLILSIMIILAGMVAKAQMHPAVKPANYEATNWKTWLLENPQQIMTRAAPGTAQSKVELQTVKQRLNAVDEKKSEQIKYWDAGAPAYRWNQVAIKLLAQKYELAFRWPAAWMNIAIYDATTLAWKEKLKYKRKRPGSLDPSLKTIVDAPGTFSYPCEHSVTAAAAAYVLAYFFTEKADSIMQMAHAASQSRIDAGVQFPSDVAAGWELGKQVAMAVIEKAKKDGSGKSWDGTMNNDPKKWTGTYPVGITLSSYTPIVLQTVDQFRLPPPPDFEKDMNEMKQFKQTYKTRSIAYFWANAGPELWNDLASQKMFEYRISDDAPAVSRIYTVLNVAFHDAVLAIFDSKYTYWGIRPDQYDTTYKPLIETPPFPGYPSGHAAGAATSGAVLSYFFPADAEQFQKLAKECADSRFYAGIHFRTDNETALQLGAAIGKYIVDTWMKK